MLVTVVGGWAILNGSDFFGTTISLGLMITFVAYVQRFNQPVQMIAVLWTNIQSGIAQRFRERLNWMMSGRSMSLESRF